MKRHTHSLQGISGGKFREARRLRREMTDSERVLWERLRRNQVHGLHFRRQHVIHGFIVDFYCREAGLVIEVDGEIHRLQNTRDQIRDAILRSKGLRILRFANNRIASAIDEVMAEISCACNWISVDQ